MTPQDIYNAAFEDELQKISGIGTEIALLSGVKPEKKMIKNASSIYNNAFEDELEKIASSDNDNNDYKKKFTSAGKKILGSSLSTGVAGGMSAMAGDLYNANYLSKKFNIATPKKQILKNTLSSGKRGVYVGAGLGGLAALGAIAGSNIKSKLSNKFKKKNA